MGSLSNLYISQSYQSLIHLATNNTASATLIGLEDGLGNSIGVSVNTAGNLFLSGTFSASLQEGYLYVGNASGRTMAFPTSSLVTNINTGSLVTTSSFNAYTASTNIRLSNIELTTASVLVSISNLNASSASQQISIDALNAFSASQIIVDNAFNQSITNLNTFTQSADIRLNNLESTSASVNISLSNINQYTQSNDAKWQDLGNKSGSWITESETGSFARYDVSNPWSADQNFTNITAFSASFTYVKTIFETASVIYSSGSNQLGDELTDVQTLSGSVLVRGGLFVNDINVTSSLNSINVFTQSANIRLNNLETTSASVNISISNLNTFTASISTASIVNSITNLNQFTQSANQRLGSLEAATSSYAISSSVAAVDAAQQAQINSLINATGSYVTESESGSFLITASFDNGTRNLTFTKGDASTFAVNIPDVSGSALDTGSFATTGSNSFNGNQTITGSFIVDYSGGNPELVIDSNTNEVTLRKTAGINPLIIESNIGGVTINSNETYIGDSANQLYPGTSANQNVLKTTRINGDFTASLAQGYVWVGDSTNTSVLVPTSSFGSTIDTGSFVTTSSFNAYTQSNDQKWSNLAGQSGSWVTSAITASSIITASVSDDDITFTKGDGSTFTIQVATGSYALSASFAETALTASIARNLIVIARNGNASTLPAGTVVHITSAVGDNPIFTTASFTTEGLSGNTFGLLRYSSPAGADVEVVVAGVVTGVDTNPANGYAAGDIVYLSSSGQFTNIQPQAPNQIVTLGQVLRAQQNNGSIYVSINNGWELDELHNVQIINPQTGDLIQYESSSYGLWKNKSIDGAGITTTSSFNEYTASTNARLSNIELTTASLLIETSNLESFTASANSRLNNLESTTASLNISVSNLNAYTSSQALLNTTFATTGSNNFRGAQQIRNVADTSGANNGVILTAHSGSLILTNNNYTTGSYGYISASNAGQNNIIFQQNSVSPDFILSGSFNIISMPAAPTAGFKRFIGIGNIALGGSNIPLMSGSMAFPITFNQNYFSGPATTITMRGPVSSSAWNISANNILGTINIGQSAANHAQSITSGLTMQSNQVNGTLNVNANQGSNFNIAPGVTGNLILGTVTLNLSSSAAAFSNNIVNDSGFILTVQSYSASIGLGNLNVSRNNIAGQSNQIISSGSIPTGTTNAITIADNFIGGANNIIYDSISTARVSGTTAYHTAARNMVYGNNLIISASSLLTDANSMGSAFFGRYNALDNRREKTAETIFAVGTGTSTTRKTGFLIDSGSNTFIEGTLNVSGSSSFTGSLTFNTGSVTMPQRTAFRVSGSATSDYTAPLTLSGSATSVDYNQGGNYNNTTGTYTAPLAGLYNVYFNGRVGSVNAQMQVIVYKNGSTPILMWEAPGTAASTHFGVSTIANLAANDTITAQVTVGTVQFDANDNWGATYIG